MNRKLDSAFRELAAELAAASPPAEIERRVLAEFDAFSRPRPPRRWTPALTALFATCAAALALAVLRPGPVRVEARFIAVPYVAPLAPYERPEVVRTQVPVAALMRAGIEVYTSDAGATVPADLLLGQDGRMLAIRFVSNSERRIN